MKTLELIVPCHFGMEAVLKREIYDLGYDVTLVEDGRVFFAGDAEAVCRANLFLRSGERVMILLGRFPATTFEEYYQGMKALPWEEYIPRDGKFWITKASSIRSRLFSSSDLQSVGKKAMVQRMKEHYHQDWFEEDGAPYPVRVFLLKNEVTVALDTTGVSLHKRGYRIQSSKAPISETLAAALIMLTPWNKNRILVDPFCGSGTFLIEAALMAANIAPGMQREFLSERWSELIPQNLWQQIRQEAAEMAERDVSVDLQGYDLDPEMVKIARENARRAGVEEYIHFQQRAVADLRHSKKYGFIITNPPYGQRLEERKDLPQLYGELGEAFAGLSDWSLYVITSYEDAPRYIGRKPDKNRKLYNGMIKTYFYQFMGQKPPFAKKGKGE